VSDNAPTSLSCWAVVRIVAIDGLLMAGLCWAAYSGRISWELPVGFVATALLTQAAPNGSTLETAVKAVAKALPTRKGT
jgi:hypothetical protein